jgi:Zn ribbon nucleic-acid-binding protein
MTYSRPTSDSMMVASTTTTTTLQQNGNHADGGAWSGNPDRTDLQHNSSEEEGGQQHLQTRELTDSPTSNGASHAAGGNPPVCQNCGTSTTPLWRRNELGATLCNACGLFLKLHGRARPMNLKTDTIKSRNRVKSVTQPKKKVYPTSWRG